MIIAKQSLCIMRLDIFASRIERSGSLSGIPVDPTTEPKTTCLTKVRSPRQTSDNGRALLEIFRRVRLQSLYDGLCCNSKPPPFNNRVRPPRGSQFTDALANVCLRNWRQAVVDPKAEVGGCGKQTLELDLWGVKYLFLGSTGPSVQQFRSLRFFVTIGGIEWTGVAPSSHYLHSG